MAVEKLFAPYAIYFLSALSPYTLMRRNVLALLTSWLPYIALKVTVSLPSAAICVLSAKILSTPSGTSVPSSTVPLQANTVNADMHIARYVNIFFILVVQKIISCTSISASNDIVHYRLSVLHLAMCPYSHILTVQCRFCHI